VTRNHIPETIFSFLVGAGIGAVAALLLAPKSGEELRGNLAEGVNDGFNQVRATGKDLKRRAEKVLDLARDQVQDAVNAADSAYSHAKKT
jgi:gas vesicle protein